MRKLNMERYRRVLEKERQRITREMELLEEAISYGDTGSGQSELANYDNHPADAGTDTFEKEKDLALRENLRSMINKIGEALAKMDRGTYGICDRCDREIAIGRLDAVPYATYCVECQSIVEGI